MKKRLPINLQFFAGEGEGGDGNPNNAGNGTEGQQSTIDYNKIQSMLDTATAKKETAVLKSYFQQQGLSEEEVSQAIQAFKENKEQQNKQQKEDNTQLQQQVADAQKKEENAQIELAATKVAISLGIAMETLPYVLKMADLSNIKDKDGKISADSIKEALNKVLEEVPGLKPQQQDNRGFQIGGGSNQQQENNQQTQIASKRWNRFNN